MNFLRNIKQKISILIEDTEGEGGMMKDRKEDRRRQGGGERRKKGRGRRGKADFQPMNRQNIQRRREHAKERGLWALQFSLKIIILTFQVQTARCKNLPCCPHSSLHCAHIAERRHS